MKPLNLIGNNMELTDVIGNWWAERGISKSGLYEGDSNEIAAG
ncbi:MAG: hypothetical protein ACQESG_02105 [Nanobdellota archaeon]